MSPIRERGTAAIVPLTTDVAVGVGLIESARMSEEARILGFDAVYRLEYPQLIAVAHALTGDREGAQDLVHDTMVKALLRWDRISRMERPGAWCHHVLVNACRSSLRRRATERRYLARLRRTEPTTPEVSADTLTFWSLVRTMPDRPRAVVALYFGADLTGVQIASVLGLPESTVRSDLAAARRVVINALGGARRD
jgi:RNA polymerase sigma factor (sigma-70 family)